MLAIMRISEIWKAKSDCKVRLAYTAYCTATVQPYSCLAVLACSLRQAAREAELVSALFGTWIHNEAFWCRRETSPKRYSAIQCTAALNKHADVFLASNVAVEPGSALLSFDFASTYAATVLCYCVAVYIINLLWAEANNNKFGLVI